MTVATRRMQQNFSRAAAQYDAHAWLQQQQVDRVLTGALQFFPPAACLLDIGCGTGQFALIARQPRPNWQITGLDFAFNMAAQAAARCAAMQADATRLPIAGASMDGVISSLCMQWVNDKPAMLAEIRRVLKPGGIAVITTLGRDTLKELREAAAHAALPLGLLPMRSFDDYRDMAADSGMQLLACQHMLESHHYPSVEALLESMRIIGAGNAQQERTRQFMAPGRFAQMTRHYAAAYGSAQGIVATWEPILMVLKNA
jgi:malonyl-CoA O-methyltransferase